MISQFLCLFFMALITNKIPFVEETLYRRVSESSSSQQAQLNIYTDPSHLYSFSYPKDLEIKSFRQGEIDLIEKGNDGPWLISVTAQSVPFSTVQEWLEEQNKQRIEAAIPLITMIKKENHEGTFFYFIKIPLDVDENSQGKRIYSSQDTVVMLKSKKLVSIAKRELLNDSKIQADFESIVQSFHWF